METVGVTPKHIARDVETVGGERRFQLRPIVIAVHERGTFHFQHALIGGAVVAVDEAQLGLGMRIADR